MVRMIDYTLIHTLTLYYSSYYLILRRWLNLLYNLQYVAVDKSACMISVLY